jgi:NAD(P)-dependent dehydrogenase (short-subunit alcohol dehydrogenase family)
MKLDNAIVLVTGANRGMGLAFAREALARGAHKVYAGARNPASVTLAGVEAVQLDVTRPEDVAAAARRCADVTLLINNAGIASVGGFLAEGSVESARQQLDTNFFGPLRLSQAFAPVLAANGGGAIVNVLSIASWINRPLLGIYGATKSAAWALTNSLRHELRAQGTQVLAMHVGFVDTDLTRGMDVPKSSPEVIVRRTLDALEAGTEEVLADEMTRQVKQGLSADPGVYLVAPAA